MLATVSVAQRMQLTCMSMNHLSAYSPFNVAIPVLILLHFIGNSLEMHNTAVARGSSTSAEPHTPTAIARDRLADYPNNTAK